MYKQKRLLTPGPLNTSQSVKNAMMIDLGTRDVEYQDLTEKVKEKLLMLANVSKDTFDVVFMQGSGTYGVESVISSTVAKQDKLLILSNGAYGKRMKEIADHAGINYDYEQSDAIKPLSLEEAETKIKASDATHVAFVHHETTAGVINDMEYICEIAHRYHKTVIVDAMSSFAGMPMQMEQVDFLITSSNKCVHGVPGLAIIFVRKDKMEHCKGNCPSLSLDLYEQYCAFADGKGFRFTSPTHVMLALDQAIQELVAQGGIKKRYAHYQALHDHLCAFMKQEGFEMLVDERDQSVMITTFVIPKDLDFQDFYEAMKFHGFLLYQGKLPGMEAFRIGNIGELDMDDMMRLCMLIHAYRKGDLIWK